MIEIITMTLTLFLYIISNLSWLFLYGMILKVKTDSLWAESRLQMCFV